MEDIDLPINTGHDAKEGVEKINIFERIANDVKNGFLGVLYLMSKNTEQSKTFAIVTIIIDAFQLSFLATPELFTKDLKMHTSLMAISSVTSAFEVSSYVTTTKTTMTTIAIVLVALLLSIVGYVGTAYVRNKLSQTWTVGLLRSTSILLMGVLYIPIVRAMASGIACDAGDAACGSLRPINVVLLVVFVLFSLSVTAVFYDARNDGVSPVRLPHSRVAVLHQAVRTLLAVLAGLLPGLVTSTSLSTIIHFWAGLLTACSLMLVFAYVWLQPYYSHRINSLRAMLVACFLWVSVGFLVSDAFAAFDPEAVVPTAVVIVGFVCTLPIVRLLISYRRSKLVDPCRRNQLSSMFPALDTELRVRVLQEQAFKQMRAQTAQGSAQGKHEKQGDIAKNLMQEAVEIFSEVSARLPESSQVSVLHAQFLLFEVKKPLLARRALLLAEARNPSFDESFVIFKMKKDLEENAFQSNDILSFVTSEKHQAIALAYDKKCCVLLVNFWRSLGDPKIDVNHVRKLADLITEFSILAQDSYKSLIKLRPLDAPIMETYAGFMETIGNDPEEARKLLLRAQDLKQRQVKMTRSSDDDNEIDVSSAILTVDASGKPLENGRVMAANTMAGRLFKQPSDFLVNKAVGTVLLPPFAHGYDNMVTQYLEQADETFFNKPFDTYVRLGGETEMALLPCRVLVKPFTSDGVNFQMYFIMTELRGETEDVLLVDPTTLAIVGGTRRLRGLISSLTPPDSANVESTINIEDAIAGYGKQVAAWRGAPAFEYDLTKVASRAVPGPVKLQVSSVRLHGPASPALDKITFTMDASYHAAEADSGSELESSVRSDSDAESYAGSDAESDADAETAAGSEGHGEDPPGSDHEDHDTAPQADDKAKKKSVGFHKSVSPASTSRTGPAGGMSKARSAGKAPSVTGGASSVGSGATTTAASLRRTMLGSRHKLDKHLTRFQRLFVYTTAMSMCMIIAMYAIRSSSLAAHEAEDPSRAGLRRFLAVAMSYFAHALVLMNKGISLPCGLDETAARGELNALSNKLKNIETDMYQRQTSYPAELRHFYDTRAVVLREIGPFGEPVLVDRTIFDASMLVAGSAQTASRMPLSEFTLDSPEVYMLIHNIRLHDHDDSIGPLRQSYLESLNTTTRIYTYQNGEFLPLMNLANAIVAALVVVVSIIILFIILLPAVNKIDNTQIAVFHELVGMPPQVFPVVGKRYTQRLELIHGETGTGPEAVEEEEDNDDADIYDEQTMLGTLQNATSSSDTKKEDKVQRKQEKHMETLNKTLRENSVRCRVMTRMSGSIVVFVLYFGVTLLSTYTMEQQVLDAPNEGNYGGLRRAALRLASHQLRMYATGGERNGGWDATYPETIEKFAEFGGIHEALIYGDHNRGLKGLLHQDTRNVNQELLMFTDGCKNWKKRVNRPSAEIPECKEYRSGLMASGLHRAILAVVEHGQILAHQIGVQIEGQNASVLFSNELSNEPVNPPMPMAGAYGMRRLLQVTPAPADAAAAPPGELDSTADAPNPEPEPEREPEFALAPGGYSFEAEDLNRTLNGPLFVQLCEMDSYYLQNQIGKSIGFYKAQAHMIIASEEMVQQISLGTLVFCTLVIYFYVVRRLVNNLDGEVKRTRALLLMIPDDILANLGGLRRFLYQEVRNQ